MPFLRQVDVSNFNREAGFLIYLAQTWKSPVVVVDTEFPGTIHSSKKPYSLLSPAERYELLKANVDDLRLIQFGITLCYSDADEALVRLGTLFDADTGIPGRLAFTWQFDLCDFDFQRHPQAPESIALLESCGIDLKRTRRLGVPSSWIAHMLLDSGLVGPASAAEWVAFQGGYDFAILLKSVLQLLTDGWFKLSPLWLPMPTATMPPTLGEFMAFILHWFGNGIFDVKCLMRSCGMGLHGGLETVAEQLDLKRVAGKQHQAGSDSLLTCQVFFKIRELYFDRISGDDESIDGVPCRGLLFGLEV